jgi:hypothetical protein
MNSKEFEQIVENRIAHLRSTLLGKREEYATDNDVLINFKNAARLKGETPAQALYGMLAKHIISWEDFVHCRKTPTKALLNEKIGDILAYFILSEGVFVEEIELKEDFPWVDYAELNAALDRQ